MDYSTTRWGIMKTRGSAERRTKAISSRLNVGEGCGKGRAKAIFPAQIQQRQSTRTSGNVASGMWPKDRWSTNGRVAIRPRKGDVPKRYEMRPPSRGEQIEWQRRNQWRIAAINEWVGRQTWWSHNGSLSSEEGKRGRSISSQMILYREFSNTGAPLKVNGAGNGEEKEVYKGRWMTMGMSELSWLSMEHDNERDERWKGGLWGREWGEISSPSCQRVL